MRLPKYVPAVSIVLVLLLAVVGTYFLRVHFLDNALRDAVQRNDLAAVSRLVDSFPCPVQWCDRNGFTPLHQAAASGNCEIAKLLLSRGAGVNAKDYENRTLMTPLHYAVEKMGNTAMVELLIAHGADTELRDHAGESPLYRTMLFGRKDNLEALIAQGADVNAPDRGGITPFATGIDGSRECLQTLIAHGADVDSRDSAGHTPLYWAVTYSNRDAVEFLIAHGADVNARDNNGYTPLSFCNLKELSQTANAKDDPAKAALPEVIKKNRAVAQLLRNAGAR
jgi:ankyrin repeat protein